MSESVIETNNVLTGGKKYSIFWDVYESTFSKLLVETDATGSVIQMSVLEIEFDFDYLEEFYSIEPDLTRFRGKVKGKKVEDYLTERRLGSSEEVEDCIRIVFGEDPPSPGGGGGINPATGGLDEVLGGLPEGCVYRMVTVCGCMDHPNGYPANPICKCDYKPNITYLIVDCPLTTNSDECRILGLC